MSANLNSLRRKYCQPGSLADKSIDHLFPLEKECGEGKSLLAATPETLLPFQEFDPSGLEQTYRDELSGAELPVFAVFDLEGSHLLSLETTVDPLRAVEEPKNLFSYLRLRGAEAFLNQINSSRKKSERALTGLSIVLGIIPVSCFLASQTIVIVGQAVPSILVGSWILNAFLFYVLSLCLLDRFLPWKKFVITAEFNGILPKKVRKKARLARHYFEKLYVIVDQQHRWKSKFLPDPRPRILDPLLIGEIKEGSAFKYFLLDQFDLTKAEEYLADEFALRISL